IRLHKEGEDRDGKIVRKLSLFIHNKGNSIIEDSKGTVYIQIQEGDKTYDVLEKDRDIIGHNSCQLSKVDFPACGIQGYLFWGAGSVRYELLPWAFSEKPVIMYSSAATAYPAVTNISPEQNSRLWLAIIRDYPDKSKAIAVVSVHSEYGEVGPYDSIGHQRLYRACLILKENRRIILNFAISGKNLRKEYKGRVEIYYENGKIKAECSKGCINPNDP
ncbi:hypothetical protein, partial [Acidianus sp. RZ1]|uniref:hypothetical protein n=1 Tax=Acidianus sp. RZ1 TaxID=1540082 RepID=UPI0018004E1D